MLLGSVLPLASDFHPSPGSIYPQDNMETRILFRCGGKYKRLLVWKVAADFNTKCWFFFIRVFRRWIPGCPLLTAEHVKFSFCQNKHRDLDCSDLFLACNLLYGNCSGSVWRWYYMESVYSILLVLLSRFVPWGKLLFSNCLFLLV